MSLYNDLTTVLTPYANKIKQNESDIGDIQDALEHLDVEADKTLSVDGKPADAKATGNAINEIKADLGDKFDGFTNVAFLNVDKRINSQGAYVTSNGCATTDYYPCEEGMQVEWKGHSFIYQGTPVMCLISFFDSTKTFISGVDAINNESVSTEGKVSVTAPQNTKYVRFSTNSYASHAYYGHVFDFVAKFRDVQEQTYHKVTSEWEIGSIDNGKNIASTTRIRSDFIFVSPGTKIKSNGNKILVFYYDLDKVYVDKTTWTNNQIDVSRTGYIRIIISLNPDATIDETAKNTLVNGTTIEQIINTYAIGQVSDKHIITKTFTGDDFSYGSLSGGNYISSTSRIYHDKYILVKTGDMVVLDNTADTNIRVSYHLYNYDYSFVASYGWYSNNINTIQRNGYIRVLLGTTDDSSISEESFDALASMLTIVSSVSSKISVTEENLLSLNKDFYDYGRSYNYQPKVAHFASEYLGTESADSFLFFSDPHLLLSGDIDSFYDGFKKFTGIMQGFYDRTPVEFAMCAGDWLEWSDTPANALYKLSIMTGRMREIFSTYYPVFGNHDNNEQGVEVDGRKALTQDEINAVMFPTFGRSYYKFNMANAKGYVLDTGTDQDSSMTAYRWAQVDWLANCFLEDDSPHSAVYGHVLWTTKLSDNLTQMMNNVQLLIGAYNSHQSITLNGTTYDFSSCTGKCGYILGGHIHDDRSDAENYSVPVIARVNTRKTVLYPSFDLVISDWGNNTLKFVRVGIGQSDSAEEFTIQ